MTTPATFPWWPSRLLNNTGSSGSSDTSVIPSAARDLDGSISATVEIPRCARDDMMPRVQHAARVFQPAARAGRDGFSDRGTPPGPDPWQRKAEKGRERPGQVPVARNLRNWTPQLHLFRVGSGCCCREQAGHLERGVTGSRSPTIDECTTDAPRESSRMGGFDGRLLFFPATTRPGRWVAESAPGRATPRRLWQSHSCCVSADRRSACSSQAASHTV